MNSIKTVQLVYFSGTGGTARVADGLEQAFMNQKVQVYKTELKMQVHTQLDTDLLVLLFPVYAFNAPKPVDEWIDQEVNANGKAAVVISVSGGGEISLNNACRVSAVRQLENKGYRVDYESMFVMPSNFVFGFNDEVCAMLLNAIPKKSQKVVSEILSGKRHRTKPQIIARIFTKFGFLEKSTSGKLFGKKLSSNEQCTGCSWCSKYCPRENIVIKNGRPVFFGKCVICLCCVYGCPQKAIIPKAGKFVLLKDGYNLTEIEKRTKYIKKFPPVSQAAKGIMLTGVRKYLQEFGSDENR